MSKKPNFIFFFPDEMRAESVSCYGHPFVEMPNYDRLAEEGVRFDQCFVQNPVCSPSRCSLMTGQYLHTQGHRTLWHLLRPHEESLFRYLKNDGYDIAWFGKNDLYSQEYLKEILGEEEFNKRHKAEQPAKIGKANENPYDLEDNEVYSFMYSPQEDSEDGKVQEKNVKKAIEFLKERKDNDKPFMLFLPIGCPHPPYHAPLSYHNKYNKHQIGDLRPSDLEGKPSFHKLIRKYRKLDNVSEDFFKEIQGVYLGMNSYVDAMLGEIMETVKDGTLDENTVIIASSDHGDWAGDYGLVEKWPNAMDDTIVRVPLIIKMPENKAGHVVKEQVELLDIMATVLEISGIEAKHTHFSKSLLPQLKGEAGDPNRAVFCEGGYDLQEPHCFEGYSERDMVLKSEGHIYYPKAKQQQEHPFSVCRTVMIRTLNYKLVKRTEDINEFYDLTKDPKELNNEYNNSTYKDVISDLESRLINWYMRTSDTVPRNDDLRGF